MASTFKLTPEGQDRVTRLAATGRYGSRDEIVDEGLRLLDERARWEVMVEAKVAEGRADAAAGRVRPLKDVFDDLEKRFAPR